MAEEFEVQLVSPEQILFEGEAEMVVCRALEIGDIAFLRGHEPYLGVLADDSVRIIRPNDTVAAAVHGGFVQMNGEKLVVLSDLAELKDDIDVPRAEAAKRAAEEALARDADDVEAKAALNRAETRLKVASGS
jgi:F-type H+-transporting ATPase subunit epsilon